MRQYFIYDGEKKGPFSFDELQQQSLKKDTLVWYEGLENWSKAESINELKPLLKVIPPPLPVAFENKNADRHEIIKSFADAEEAAGDNNKKSLLLPFLITLIIVAGILITLFYYRK